MTIDNTNIPADGQFRRESQVESQEAPYDGGGYDDGLAQEEEATERMLGESLQRRGWPGDGSGEDDFADYNQNEADDYMGE
jgi:hypothetical protein